MVKCGEKVWFGSVWHLAVILVRDGRGLWRARAKFSFTLFLYASACVVAVLLFKLACLARSHTLAKAKKNIYNDENGRTAAQRKIWLPC